MEATDALKNMRKYAEELANDERYKTSEMAANDQYIRYGGNGYIAVSLNNSSAICKFSQTKKKPTNDLDKIFKQFKEDKPVCMNEDVQVKKEERRLQAWIIKKSLANNRNMIKSLSLSECPYDELTFVTDEISLGHIRCDILAICKISDRYHPVLIELKSGQNDKGRKKKRLIEQLNFFCHEIENFKQEFSELLSIFIKNKNATINTDKPHKIIIWPVAESEKGDNKYRKSKQAETTRKDILAEHISLLEYYPLKDMNGFKFMENWS
jgi:hypothetical protein